MACDQNCDEIPDLDCPKFDGTLVTWLNTLKNKVYELCDCLLALTELTCAPVNLTDDAVIPDSYVKADFAFADINLQEVNSSITLGLTATINNTDMTVYSITANRFKLGFLNNPATAKTGQFKLKFAQPICDLTLNIFDVDFPAEDFTGWSKAPDSITPAFGNLVDSVVVFTDINSDELTVTYSTIAEEVAIHIILATECAPCFAAQKCTNLIGDLEYRDLSDDVLPGTYTEC
jgi:hypothetical protein